MKFGALILAMKNGISGTVKSVVFWQIKADKITINPSRPVHLPFPPRAFQEVVIICLHNKINLNFYFRTFLWYFKRF